MIVRRSVVYSWSVLAALTMPLLGCGPSTPSEPPAGAETGDSAAPPAVEFGDPAKADEGPADAAEQAPSTPG